MSIHVGLSPYKKQIAYILHQLDNATLYLAGRLLAYKIAKINTQKYDVMVGKINNILSRATEIVNEQVIYN